MSGDEIPLSPTSGSGSGTISGPGLSYLRKRSRHLTGSSITNAMSFVGGVPRRFIIFCLTLTLFFVCYTIWMGSQWATLYPSLQIQAASPLTSSQAYFATDAQVEIGKFSTLP